MMSREELPVSGRRQVQIAWMAIRSPEQEEEEAEAETGRPNEQHPRRKQALQRKKRRAPKLWLRLWLCCH